MVGNKKNQRWLWYAWCADTGRVLAYEFGRRTDEVLEKLFEHLKAFKIKVFFTGDRGAYERLLHTSLNIGQIEIEHVLRRHSVQSLCGMTVESSDSADVFIELTLFKEVRNMSY